jgi:hypothetical protein
MLEMQDDSAKIRNQQKKNKEKKERKKERIAMLPVHDMNVFGNI